MNQPYGLQTPVLLSTLNDIKINYSLYKTAKSRRDTYLLEALPDDTNLVKKFGNKEQLKIFSINPEEKSALNNYLQRVLNWFRSNSINDSDSNTVLHDAINAYGRNDLDSLKRNLFVSYSLRPEFLGADELNFLVSHSADLNDVDLRLDQAPFEIAREHGAMALMDTKELREHLEGQIREIIEGDRIKPAAYEDGHSPIFRERGW